jgi:hypothetical protein
VTMTSEEIEALERAVEAMTPGPWAQLVMTDQSPPCGEYPTSTLTFPAARPCDGAVMLTAADARGVRDLRNSAAALIAAARDAATYRKQLFATAIVSMAGEPNDVCDRMSGSQIIDRVTDIAANRLFLLRERVPELEARIAALEAGLREMLNEATQRDAKRLDGDDLHRLSALLSNGGDDGR